LVINIGNKNRISEDFLFYLFIIHTQYIHTCTYLNTFYFIATATLYMLARRGKGIQKCDT